MSKEAEAKGLVDAALSEFGRLDILVNNSGVYEFAAIEASTEEQYRKMFDVNVLGTLLTTKAAVPHLGEGASVINISSNITSVLLPETAIYTGTKGAVDAITGVLAKELGPRKIRVNAINPGVVETEGVQVLGFLGTEFETGIVAQTPLGRTGQPSDIASVAVFLRVRRRRLADGREAHRQRRAAVSERHSRWRALPRTRARHRAAVSCACGRWRRCRVHCPEPASP